MTEEGLIKLEICNWLEERGALPCITGNKGKLRYKSKFMRAGVLDVFFLWEGQAAFVEVKRPGGKVSDEQVNFMHTAIELGALCFLVESLDELILALEPH